MERRVSGLTEADDKIAVLLEIARMWEEIRDFLAEHPPFGWLPASVLADLPPNAVATYGMTETCIVADLDTVNKRYNQMEKAARAGSDRGGARPRPVTCPPVADGMASGTEATGASSPPRSIPASRKRSRKSVRRRTRR